MAMRVPAPQQGGAARYPQQPQQHPDRKAIRGAQPEGPVQGLVKSRTFFQLLDGQCPEFEPPFRAADAPVSRRLIGIADHIDDRICQCLGQLRALIPGDDENTPAISYIVPIPQRVRRAA